MGSSACGVVRASPAERALGRDCKWICCTSGRPAVLSEDHNLVLKDEFSGPDAGGCSIHRDGSLPPSVALFLTPRSKTIQLTDTKQAQQSSGICAVYSSAPGLEVHMHTAPSESWGSLRAWSRLLSSLENSGVPPAARRRAPRSEAAAPAGAHGRVPGGSCQGQRSPRGPPASGLGGRGEHHWAKGHGSVGGLWAPSEAG